MHCSSEGRERPASSVSNASQPVSQGQAVVSRDLTYYQEQFAALFIMQTPKLFEKTRVDTTERRGIS